MSLRHLIREMLAANYECDEPETERRLCDDLVRLVECELEPLRERLAALEADALIRRL